MQPQSEKNIIQRFLEWWRGRPGGDSGSDASTTRGTSEVHAGEPDSNSSTSGTEGSITGNARGLASTLQNRMADLADKGSDLASDAGKTAANVRNRALDAPDKLRGAFSETDQNQGDAERTTGSENRESLSASPDDRIDDSGADRGSAANSDQSSDTLGASDLGDPVKSSSGTDDTVRLDNLTPSRFASEADDAGTASRESSTAGGSEGMRSLYHGSTSTTGAIDDSATRSADDNIGGAFDEPEAPTGTTPGGQQPDLSGTAYDRADAGATFNDLSAADSLASGAYADEELLDSPDSDLQGFSDLHAEDLGTLEDIESETSASDMVDELGIGTSFDADAEPDQSGLAGTLDDERDAFVDAADSADQPDAFLVVEEDVIILGWDADAGTTLDSTGVIDTAYPSDSTETGSMEEVQTAGIAGMPGTSEASGMPDAAETNLAPEEDADSATDSETASTNPSSTADASTAERVSSRTAGSTTGSPEHFGFLGYDNTATTDLSYLNQANARRFDFATAAPDAPQAGKSIGETQAQPEEESQGRESDHTDSESRQTAASGGSGGTTDEAKSQPSNALSAPADKTSRPSPAYVQEGTEPDTIDTGLASHTTTQGDMTAATQATTGGSAQSEPEQTGPGGSIKGDKSGSCPADYPIKGNGSSKIYHIPGIPSYRGTKAEFCFATEADAIAAGFRAPGQRNHSAGTAAHVSSGEEGVASGTATQAADSSSASDTATHGADLSSASGAVGSDASTSNLRAPAITAFDHAATTASTSNLSDAGKDADRSSATTTGNTSASGDNEDQSGSGSDDIESLRRQSPDDVAASAGSSQSTGTATTASDESHNDMRGGKGIKGVERHIAGAVPGDGSHSCPADYPIKGNAGSMIFHSPGRSSYATTIPEWCFATEEDALKAGFRAPKR